MKINPPEIAPRMIDGSGISPIFIDGSGSTVGIRTINGESSGGAAPPSAAGSGLHLTRAGGVDTALNFGGTVGPVVTTGVLVAGYTGTDLLMTVTGLDSTLDYMVDMTWIITGGATNIVLAPILTWTVGTAVLRFPDSAGTIDVSGTLFAADQIQGTSIAHCIQSIIRPNGAGTIAVTCTSGQIFFATTYGYNCFVLPIESTILT
jgi:hypothetical protein